MHAVISRIQLREPLTREQIVATQRDVDGAAGAVDGLAAIHILRTEDGDLVVLVLGEDQDALDRTRDVLGNALMRKHVIPHAAGPPERTIAEALVSWERG